MIRSMVKENINGQVVIYIMEVMQRIKDTDGVKWCGLMVLSMKENGQMVLNMATVSCFFLQERRKKDSLRTEYSEEKELNKKSNRKWGKKLKEHKLIMVKEPKRRKGKDLSQFLNLVLLTLQEFNLQIEERNLKLKNSILKREGLKVWIKMNQPLIFKTWWNSVSMLFLTQYRKDLLLTGTSILKWDTKKTKNRKISYQKYTKKVCSLTQTREWTNSQSLDKQ